APRRRCKWRPPLHDPHAQRLARQFPRGHGRGRADRARGLARHRVLPQPNADSVHVGEAQAAGEERRCQQGAADRRAAPGWRRAGHRGERRGGEAEVRLLPHPAGLGRAGKRQGAARARAPAARGRQERRQSTGNLEGRLFHPGRLVPEPGRRRQPEGAPRDPRFRVERGAGEPSRQGDLVPGADGALRQGRGNQQGASGAGPERHRGQPDQSKGPAMNRVRRSLVIALSLMPLALAWRGAFAQSNGNNVTELNPPLPTESDGKIEVLEFFWYGCIHCYNLEPRLETWLKTKPADVAFRRVPAVLSDRWGHDAVVFYAFEVLGVLDKLHRPFFDAIHRERLRSDNMPALNAWLEKNGVDAKKFEATARSFGVQ